MLAAITSATLRKFPGVTHFPLDARSVSTLSTKLLEVETPKPDTKHFGTTSSATLYQFPNGNQQLGGSKTPVLTRSTIALSLSQSSLH